MSLLTYCSWQLILLLQKTLFKSEDLLLLLCGCINFRCKVSQVSHVYKVVSWMLGYIVFEVSLCLVEVSRFAAYIV